MNKPIGVLHHECGSSTASADPENALGADGEYDRFVCRPRGAERALCFADLDRCSTLDKNFLELFILPEPDPLAVWREEWIQPWSNRGCAASSSNRLRLQLIQAPQIQLAVRGVDDARPIWRNRHDVSTRIGKGRVFAKRHDKTGHCRRGFVSLNTTNPQIERRRANDNSHESCKRYGKGCATL